MSRALYKYTTQKRVQEKVLSMSDNSITCCPEGVPSLNACYARGTTANHVCLSNHSQPCDGRGTTANHDVHMGAALNVCHLTFYFPAWYHRVWQKILGGCSEFPAVLIISSSSILTVHVVLFYLMIEPACLPACLPGCGTLLKTPCAIVQVQGLQELQELQKCRPQEACRTPNGQHV